MPCDVDWLIDDRIVRAKYYGIVTAGDIRQQAATTVAMIDMGVAPVHVLIDSSGVESVGIGIGDLRSLSVKTLPTVGWTVIIAPNTLHRFFISIGMQFTRGNYKFVDTEDEAIDFVIGQDPTVQKPVM